MIRAGLTEQVAIDRIHSVYGEGTNVTKIINGMKADIKEGRLNPSLQV